MKKILFGYASVALSLFSCKSANSGAGSAELESAGKSTKKWSCVGPIDTESSGKTKKDLARISIFTDGTTLTKAQLFIAASGSASTWEPAKVSKALSSSALKISDWELQGAGAKQIQQPARFSVNIHKNSKKIGPEYSFKTYSRMDGYATDVFFVGVSVTGTWVQKFEATGDWVCSDQTQYLK